MKSQIRGHGSLYKSYQERNQKEREKNALETLRETGYFDRQGNNDSSIVDVEGVKQNIEGGSSGQSDSNQEVLPTYNAGAQTERNRQSQMNQMLQQHGKILLDPAGGAVMGAGLGMVLGDGKLQNALLGGGLGYLLARSNTINLPRGKKSFDQSQELDDAQSINGLNGVTSESEELYKKKADISSLDPDKSLGDGLTVSSGFTDAATNRDNTFGKDAVTMLAQSFKTTGDQTIGNNMQPNIGSLEGGIEATWEGGSPGNVPNPADELVASFKKEKVPSYLFQTLGGSVA